MKVNFALCASALSLAIAAIIIDIASLVTKTHPFAKPHLP